MTPKLNSVLGRFLNNPMEREMAETFDKNFNVDEFVELVCKWHKTGSPFMKIDARKMMGMRVVNKTYTDEEYPVDKLMGIVARCRLEGIPFKDKVIEIVNLAI